MRRDAIGLQVSLDVEGRHGLILGGGDEAYDKATRLLEGDAWVTVIGPTPGEGVARLAAEGRIRMVVRPFDPGDVESADLVFVCERDPELVAAARAAVAQYGAAMWACDDPEHSDMALPALARLGRARVAVSTGGAAPSLASEMRQAIERDLGERFAAFVAALGEERERILASVADPDQRRELLRALVDGFELHLHARYPDRA